jgi:hypothetical protein
MLIVHVGHGNCQLTSMHSVARNGGAEFEPCNLSSLVVESDQASLRALTRNRTHRALATYTAGYFAF